MRRFKTCSPDRWTRIATEEAQKDGVDPVKVLNGNREPAYVAPRWRAFCILYQEGCSHLAISRASGFDRSAIGYVVDPGRRAAKIAYRRRHSPGLREAHA